MVGDGLHIGVILDIAPEIQRHPHRHGIWPAKVPARNFGLLIHCGMNKANTFAQQMNANRDHWRTCQQGQPRRPAVRLLEAPFGRADCTFGEDHKGTASHQQPSGFIKSGSAAAHHHRDMSAAPQIPTKHRHLEQCLAHQNMHPLPGQHGGQERVGRGRVIERDDLRPGWQRRVIVHVHPQHGMRVTTHHRTPRPVQCFLQHGRYPHFLTYKSDIRIIA